MKKTKNKKIALITGITGQDGSYLAEFLLEKNYTVYGLCRRVSYFNRNRIEHLRHNKNLKLIYGDLNDFSSVMDIIKKSKPDEIYNLAAQSHVYVSFNVPEYTANVNSLGLLRILDCVKNLNLKKTKIYQASTSEMFGNTKKKSIDENTQFNPVSPYGAAKMYSYYISEIYSKSYGLYIANGILFNHESPRRGINFISKKITTSIADIISKKKKYFVVGNLNAKRDWGYAKDYVVAMWKILQQKKPDDFVIATGKNYSVKYFAEEVFKKLDFNIKWRKKNNQVEAYDYKTKKVLIKIDKFYFRPTELDSLRGDYSKAKKVLNWSPKTNIKDLITIMIKAEMEKIL